MFFLFNTVVVKTQLHLDLPAKVAQLSMGSAAMILAAGRELYADHPDMEHRDLETVRWYCTLLLQKVPNAGAVRFYPSGAGYGVELKPMSLTELVRLWKDQNRGVNIAPDVHAFWLGCRIVA